jgi:hypothetical protein
MISGPPDDTKAWRVSDLGQRGRPPETEGGCKYTDSRQNVFIELGGWGGAERSSLENPACYEMLHTILDLNIFFGTH